jgi:hypothetical protein
MKQLSSPEDTSGSPAKWASQYPSRPSNKPDESKFHIAPWWRCERSITTGSDVGSSSDCTATCSWDGVRGSVIG